MIKIAFIESDPKTFGYLRALLSGAEGSEHIKLTGAYRFGKAALDELPGNIPDVLITDISLSDMAGIDVVHAVKEKYRETRMLIHSAHEGREQVFSAFKAGAIGYILKGTSSLEIISAVKEVMRGGAPMSPRIAQHIINELRKCNPKMPDLLLTQREREVLTGMANDLSKRKIAEKLLISPHTVHAHTKKIYRKLKVKSKMEAITKAKVSGLI